MAHVRSHPLAEDSLLHGYMKQGDFLDCYSVSSDASPRDAAITITSFPPWAQFLVGIRNMVVRPFGILPEGPGDGPKLGVFPITDETDSEVIAGFDDKHLDFRVSVHARDGMVSLATWVHPHNLGGRAYLAAIMPFHVLIARNALHRVAAR